MGTREEGTQQVGRGYSASGKRVLGKWEEGTRQVGRGYSTRRKCVLKEVVGGYSTEWLKIYFDEIIYIYILKMFLKLNKYLQASNGTQPPHCMCFYLY